MRAHWQFHAQLLLLTGDGDAAVRHFTLAIEGSNRLPDPRIRTSL
jgi:hypothetical protein